MINENLKFVRSLDNLACLGVVCEVSSTHFAIYCEQANDLQIGDHVMCVLSGDESNQSIAAEVTEIDRTNCKLTVLVLNGIPGVVRASRAVVPGSTIILKVGDDELIGSICDVSESGLRVRSFGGFEVGQELELSMDTHLGQINFKGRIARVVQSNENDSAEAGIQITEIGRLERARYNHFVDGLLRKAKKAS
ncbi:MAG: PilZ domain-containing protein [Fimbriimonadaceae bacterium]